MLELSTNRTFLRVLTKSTRQNWTPFWKNGPNLKDNHNFHEKTTEN